MPNWENPAGLEAQDTKRGLCRIQTSPTAGQPSCCQAYAVQALEFELARELSAAMREVSALVDKDPSPHTPEGERLDALSTLIEDYERKHHSIDLPAQPRVRGA